MCSVSAKGRSTADAKAVHDYIREITLTTYVEGLSADIRGQIKSRNLPSLEEAIKESMEEEKIYQSNKDTQRLLQGKTNTHNSGKYCKHCRKNNHNTNECRYANRGVDTGQQNKQNKDTNYQKNVDTKRPTCAYCKKPGHLLEECYKKKNADARKANQNGQNQPSTSGKANGPDKTGIRPVRELKAIAQN